MRNLAKVGMAIVAAVGSFVAASASAAIVTMTFDGQNPIVPGPLGGGAAFSGTIVMDTDTAASGGVNRFVGLYQSAEFISGGTTFTSTGPEVQNSLTQVQLAGGSDAFLSKFETGYSGTVGGLTLESITLELRMLNGSDLFNDPAVLFDALASGDTLDLSDIGYISLVLNYSSGLPTIIRYGSFNEFDISVSGDPVPLPPAAALFAGILTLGFAARRRSS